MRHPPRRPTHPAAGTAMHPSWFWSPRKRGQSVPTEAIVGGGVGGAAVSESRAQGKAATPSLNETDTRHALDRTDWTNESESEKNKREEKIRSLGRRLVEKRSSENSSFVRPLSEVNNCLGTGDMSANHVGLEEHGRAARVRGGVDGGRMGVAAVAEAGATDRVDV